MKTKHQAKLSSVSQSAKALAALLGVALATSAGATDITLVNPSLEDPSYYNPNDAYPGWVGVGWGAVSFTGWSMYGPVGAAPVAHDGSQSLWSCWGAGWNSLSQNSAYTVLAAGETLTAGIWAKTEVNVGSEGVWFNVQLTLDGSQMAFAQPNLSAGTDWTQINTTYVTTAADIGKTVGISFGTDAGQYGYTGGANYCYMDMASLTTVAPVPEPTTMALGVLGALVMVVGMKRNRK